MVTQHIGPFFGQVYLHRILIKLGIFAMLGAATQQYDSFPW